MRKIILKIDNATQFLSCMFIPKHADIAGSLFCHYAQKVSFLSCLLYGMIIFFVLGIKTITWPVLLSYIVLTLLMTEIVFIDILKRFGRSGLPQELANNMSIVTACLYILISLGATTIGLFAHQYFYIGPVSGNAFGIFAEIILMAIPSSLIYPTCLAFIQLGVFRLFLTDRSK